MTGAVALRGHVRNKQYIRLAHGLHLRAGAEAADRLAELVAWRLLLPETGCFTGVTAALAYGWRLPALPPDTPVFMAMQREVCRPRRAEVRVFRHPVAPTRVVRDGLPLVSPPDALLAAARHLSPLDLLIMVDSALHAGDTTVPELAAACARRRGGPVLRSVLVHADGRAESAWETPLRMFHHACEVPVVPQYEVRDGAGAFVARGDLWMEGTRTLHEYDGGVHRDPAQHHRDLARDRALTGAGWVRRGYTAVDLLRQPEVILREADATLGRPHDPGRLAGWRALVRESTLSREGMARLRRLWRLSDL